jgi:DNA-binding SARP family transcriptional activator/TolB-like protein
MAIQLVTFGGLHAIDDSGGLDRLLGQHSRAALFIYLAVERRVARESLTAVFWPESDAENARHALRQSLYHLRKAVGRDWIESRAHELVVTDDVRTDAHAFANALDRADIASAVDLYRGPFLDGVHLVDLQPWEAWVDARRAHYARAFRKACRDLLEGRSAAGDPAGAIHIAERWAARDPADDEAQHRLIAALAAAGERAEAIRQYEIYARRLEQDGQEPLDETRDLADRLRSESLPLPALRASIVPAQSPATVEVPDTPATSSGSTDHVRREIGQRRSPPRRSLRWLGAAAMLMLLSVSVWAVSRSRLEPTPMSSSSIAVLPFDVRGGQAVEYLGSGIVNLLGAALDGAGSLRRVDTRATFAAIAGEAAHGKPDAQRAEQVARRLGAGMYVLGDVVEAGGHLQIDAAIYRVGAGAPSTRAVVSGAADSVFDLVDRLAARLLGGLGDPAADRLVRTASLTTTSLPAFKSYLQGEELMRDGQFERAAEMYLAAIAQDSTFAVAHYRLALAREWAPLAGEDKAANAAARHGERLSVRDRNLLEAFRAWRAGDAAEAERAYRSILARYPDDIDAWFQLGEILFHHGPLFGRPIAESEEAWRKVLSYEPRNLFALTHVARMALVARRLTSLDSLLAPFAPNDLHTDRRLAELVLLRAVARGDTAAAHAMAKDVRRWEPFAVWRVAVFLTAFTPDPGLMRSVVTDLIEDFPSPAERADLLWFASVLELAGGRGGAARIALAQAVEAERTVPAERRRSGFRDVTEWFAATLPLPWADSTLTRVRREAAARVVAAERTPAFETEMGIGTPVQLEPVRQYTLGILSLRLRDTTAASAAAAALQRLAGDRGSTALTRDLDRGLRARLAHELGRANEALGLLQTLESRDSQGDVAAIPFVSRASERYLRGDVLASLGRDAEALRWFASLGEGSVTEIPLRAPSHLRQAEIYERLGKPDEAARHYARFLELWHNSDPEFRPPVQVARGRLASLTQIRSPLDTTTRPTR